MTGPVGKSWSGLFEHRATLGMLTERVDFTTSKGTEFSHVSYLSGDPDRVRLWFRERPGKPNSGLFMIVKEETIPAVNYELVRTFEAANGLLWCLYILKEG